MTKDLFAANDGWHVELLLPCRTVQETSLKL